MVNEYKGLTAKQLFDEAERLARESYHELSEVSDVLGDCLAEISDLGRESNVLLFRR